MSNAIGRIRLMGIAVQPTFGTPAPSATHVLPLTNAPQFNAEINKAMNNAALGSAYSLNDIEKTTRFSNIPLEFKVDEDQLPLIMKQRFSIASVTASTSGVYIHTLSFQNSTNSWYTLFLEDDDRQDYVVKDALFDNIDLAFDNDFVRVTSSVVGAYPTATAVSLTAVQPKEFVGRMVSYLDDDVPGTVSASSVLSLGLSMDFGLNSEDTRFGLGSADLAALRLTTDKYMLNVTQLKSDTTRYDENEGLTMKQFRVLAQSTDRYIASQTVTYPTIRVDVPRSKIESYAEQADLDELVREVFDLTALHVAGVSGAPMSMTVYNATASY